MKVLHVTQMTYPVLGIVHQIEDESKAADILGLDWDVKSYGKVELDSKIFTLSNCEPSKRFKFKKKYYEWVYGLINKNNYDVVLIRYQPCDYLFYFFLKKFQKKAKVYLVLHSLLLSELSSYSGISFRYKSFVEYIFGFFNIRKSDGIIAVTQEVALKEMARSKCSGKKYIVYPNGISYDNISTAFNDERNENLPELLFVASEFASWHGLDLFCDALLNSKIKCIVHIVGKIPKSIELRLILDSRCKVYGLLPREKISELVNRAWLGLSSFAHFRLGMAQASTLKVREYLSLGLPVYATYKESFPSNFHFYRNGPCDLKEIIQYSYEMRKYSRTEVSMSAKPFIDKVILLEDLYKKLEIALKLMSNC